MTQEEVRSEPPAQANRLSADKMTFLHTQETQPLKKLDASSPGRLVIPDFNQQQHSSTIEVKELTPPAKVEKRKTDEWITQVVTQEEVRLEPPAQANRLSGDKMTFLHTEEIQPVKKGDETLDRKSCGKIFFPKSNHNRFSINVQARSPGLQKERQNGQEWITQSRAHVEAAQQPTPSSKMLSPAGKPQLHSTGSSASANTLSGSTSGSLVIHDFNRDRSSMQVEEIVPPPMVKRNSTQQWETKVITNEEFPSEGPGTVQIIQTYQTHPVSTTNSVSSAVVNVVPGSYQHSFSAKIQDGERNGGQWIKEPSPSTFSAGETQLVQSDETHRVITLDGSSGGSVVIPIQIDQTSFPSNVKIRNG